MSHIRSSNTHRRTIIAAMLLFQFLLVACGSAQSTPAAPRVYKVGILSGGTNFDTVLSGFKAGMTGLGYVEGKNLTYVYNGPANSNDLDKLQAQGQDLLKAQVDLILTLGTPASQAAQKITTGTSLPVVFVPVGDPVSVGIVQSLLKPGANITGVTSTVAVTANRLEWLVKAVPTIKRVFVPYDTDDPATALYFQNTTETAPKLGLELVTRPIANNDDVTAAIKEMPGKADAIFLLPGSIVGARLADFVKASLEDKLPMSSPITGQVNQGVFLAYGFGNDSSGKQAAGIVDRIFKGAKPADLPVETAEFYLALNLKTAQAIGVTVPDEVLRQAATIIRDTK